MFLPVTPARLLPPLAETLLHRSHLSAAATLLACCYGFSCTSVHPCCAYARACVQYSRASSQPLSLAFNFGWMARLPPAVLHLSSRRRGVSGPLHIPLLIISFNLGEKKEIQAVAAVSTPHLEAATWTCTPFCLLLFRI